MIILSVEGFGKPKVIHYTNVERVEVRNAERTWIRVLISKKDGAPTYAMRIFEIEPGGHIPLHDHPWEHEIFVLEGKLRIRIGDEVYEVSNGTAIYIPPNIPHEYWNVGDGILRFICTIPHKPTAPSQ